MRKKWIVPLLAGLCAAALCLPAALRSRADAQEEAPPAALSGAPEEDAPVGADAVPAAASAPAEADEPAWTLEDVLARTFSDVPAGDPAAGCIGYMACRGVLTGVGGGSFAPRKQVTRAALMTALFRLSGQEAPAGDSPFPDVDGDSWYAGAVAWAAEAGIALGNADGTFAPDTPVTRLQLAVFLSRYAQRMGFRPDAAEKLDLWPDGGEIPGYARADVSWAMGSGLYRSLVSEAICPRMPVSRAQLAQVLTALEAQRGRDPLAGELAAALTPPEAPASGVSLAHHDEIQALVDAVAEKYGAIGLQAAVIEDGRVTDAYAWGWAVKNSVPMTTDHKLRVASITKVAVAAGAMLLREQGVIGLDDDIGPYWGASFRNPRYPDVPITFRSLLSHTSSIRVLEDAPRTREAIKSTLSGPSGYSGVRPGAIGSWNYNNYGFGVLGVTLELASGRFLDDILNESIWSCLGVDAAFESGSIRETDKLAALYYHGGSTGRSVQSLKGSVRPDTPGALGTYFAGGLTISARDLAQLAALLANDGCFEGVSLLDAGSVELMETYSPQRLSGGFYQALPLRYQTDIYGRERLYYHTGSAYGVYNCMSYDPDTRDGVVVLSVGASPTADSHGIYAVCGSISEYIYQLLESEG